MLCSLVCDDANEEKSRVTGSNEKSKKSKKDKKKKKKKEREEAEREKENGDLKEEKENDKDNDYKRIKNIENSAEKEKETLELYENTANPQEESKLSKDIELEKKQKNQGLEDEIKEFERRLEQASSRMEPKVQLNVSHDWINKLRQMKTK